VAQIVGYPGHDRQHDHRAWADSARWDVVRDGRVRRWTVGRRTDKAASIVLKALRRLDQEYGLVSRERLADSRARQERKATSRDHLSVVGE
jgi:hypothetical protein